MCIRLFPLPPYILIPPSDGLSLNIWNSNMGVHNLLMQSIRYRYMYLHPGWLCPPSLTHDDMLMMLIQN